MTATCNFTGAAITDTLKSKDQLVPYLKQQHNQIIKLQENKIDYIRVDNAGESIIAALEYTINRNEW